MESAHDTAEPYGAGYVLAPGEGIGDFGAAVKAAGISTGGALTLIESQTDGGAPWHVHSREDEYFYVLDGTIVVHCGEQTFEAGPRAFVALPRGIPHAWDVVGEQATLLMMTVPAMLETFLHAYHGAPPAERTRIAEQYGLTFL